jgi:hypothetical protein
MGDVSLQAGSATIGRAGVTVEWAAAGAPAAGQSLSGDHHLVLESGGGLLIAVVDALGHGPNAWAVAESAVAAFEYSASEPLSQAVARCHSKLAGTRGAVGTVAWFDGEGTLSWLAVGNVAAFLMRRRLDRMHLFAAATAHAGIIGMQLPALHESRFMLEDGDLLLMATDGIKYGFDRYVDPEADLARVTAEFVTESRLAHDDGLVLAARYHGAAGR